MAAIGYKIEMNNSARAKGWLCQPSHMEKIRGEAPMIQSYIRHTRNFEAKLLCFSHTSAIREISRQSSYASVIRPPYEKIRGEDPILQSYIRHTRKFEAKLL